MNSAETKDATHELLTERAWETKLTEWIPGPTDKQRGKTCSIVYLLIRYERLRKLLKISRRLLKKLVIIGENCCVGTFQNELN